MIDKVVLVTPHPSPGVLVDVLCQERANLPVSVVASNAQYLEERNSFTPNTLLLCYGTGLIVESDVLQRLNRPAYNFHAASPEYPGRDPHHWAIYDGARRYGATAHEMTERVDAGPIVGVEWFDVPENIKPGALLSLANNTLFRLFEALGPKLVRGETLASLSDVQWTGQKRSRRDFHAVCNLSPGIDKKELEHRYRAFDGEGRDNLSLDLHGKRFRIDSVSGVSAANTESDEWADFTEKAYVENLRLAKAHYRFARFGDTTDDRHVLWRHDVDFSVHRALALARLEAGEGVRVTYFLNSHSAFYNLLEPEITELISEIIQLGHDIGLHFDASAYPGTDWDSAQLTDALARERGLLEQTFGCSVGAFSYHNPDDGGMIHFDSDEIAGLVNAYGKRLREGYTYCSDSNGYWRHQRLPDLLEVGEAKKLHVLTHPAWWTEEPMSPRRRIDRAVGGRADAVMGNYDSLLAKHGRENSE